MKPRIAFCFSGQSRLFAATLPYFQKFFFDAAHSQGFDYDIFAAVEDDTDLPFVEKNIKLTAIEKISSASVSKLIEERYGEYKRNHIGKGVFLTQILGTKFENMLQQFYKIERADLLRQNHEITEGFHYDIVLRLRFDLLFFEVLDFEKILEALRSNPNQVLMDLSPTEEHKIHDQFAIGSSSSMTEYSPLFSEIVSILETKEYTTKQKMLLALTKPIRSLSGYLSRKSLSASKNLWNLLFSQYTKFLVRSTIPAYTCEMIVYKNLHRKHISITEASISFIMVREKRELSGLKLAKDSPYTKKDL